MWSLIAIIGKIYSFLVDEFFAQRCEMWTKDWICVKTNVHQHVTNRIYKLAYSCILFLHNI